MHPPAEKAAYSPANGRKMLGPKMFRDRGEGGAALPLFLKIIKSYYEKSVFSPTMHFESLVSSTTFKVAPRSLMLRPFAWALKMTSTQLVETSVTINNSPSPSYTNPEDHPTTIIDLPCHNQQQSFSGLHQLERSTNYNCWLTYSLCSPYDYNWEFHTRC